MRQEVCASYPIQIWMAGSYWKAKKICRKYCDEIGFCVSVSFTEYIYTGGKELGFVVGIINYPRFPASREDLLSKAFDLAKILKVELKQDSYSIQTPEGTIWHSFREQDL